MRHIRTTAVGLCTAVVFLALTQLASAQIGRKLIIPNFVSDPEKLETHLVISDVDGTGPNIRISIYADNGKLVYERYETLKAFGKLNYNPLDHLNAYQHGYGQKPQFKGTIRVISEGGNIAGQYWEIYKNQDMKYMNTAVPAADGVGYDKLACQHFVSDKPVESALVIANAESDRETIINVKFYSDEGGLVSSEKFTIPENGIVRIDPFKLTKNIRMTGTAYVTVVGAGKVAGEYWQTSPNDRYRIALPLEGVTKVR